MNYVETVIAKKYASAFETVFSDSLSLPVAQRCLKLATYMRTHGDILFFLQMSAIDDAQKKTGLLSLIKKYELPDCMMSLIELLIAHKRSFLCPVVLQALYELYIERQHIMAFTITSSHPLPESEVHSIQRFLARSTSNTIIYTCIVDPALIAGIRLSNSTLFWEQSAAKQLRDAHNMLVE